MQLPLIFFFSQERVDVTASSSDGSYYRLSAVLNMTSDRTKVERNYIVPLLCYVLDSW